MLFVAAVALRCAVFRNTSDKYLHRFNYKCMCVYVCSWLVYATIPLPASVSRTSLMLYAESESAYLICIVLVLAFALHAHTTDDSTTRLRTFGTAHEHQELVKIVCYTHAPHALASLLTSCHRISECGSDAYRVVCRRSAVSSVWRWGTPVFLSNIN